MAKKPKKRKTILKVCKKNLRDISNIDRGLVEKMAADQASAQEIADFFGVSLSTIYKNYKDVLCRKSVEKRLKLRQAQLDVALDGNPTMLIWLGKQYLGQSEKVESKNENINQNEEMSKDLKSLSVAELATLLALQKKLKAATPPEAKFVEATVTEQKKLKHGS